MIQKSVIVLLLYFCTGSYDISYNLVKIPISQCKDSTFPYQSKAYLHAYPKAAESLRAPEITTLININTADAKQLQQLPTIGPKRSEAIIKYRETLPSKQFESIEQLLNIKSIPPKTFKRIRAYIVI